MKAPIILIMLWAGVKQTITFFLNQAIPFLIETDLWSYAAEDYLHSVAFWPPSHLINYVPRWILRRLQICSGLRVSFKDFGT